MRTTSSSPKKLQTTGSSVSPPPEPTNPEASALGSFATARDSVRRLDGREGDLEVISLLAKEHWLINVFGIIFRDTTYFLTSREVIDYGTKSRHHFLLKKAPEDAVFNGYIHYDPDEVREIFRRRQRDRSATWVGTFTLLLGFLDAEHQQQLANVYSSFDSRKATRWSIAASLGVGGTNLLQTGSQVFGRGAGPLYLVAFVVGALLVWDGVQRLLSYRRGIIEGSIFAILVRPLAGRYLRWDVDVGSFHLVPGRLPAVSLDAETASPDLVSEARSRAPHPPVRSPTRES